LVRHSPSCPRGFPRERRFLPATVPRLLAQTVHPLVRFTPLQSVPGTKPAPRLATWSAFHGVAIPLRDISSGHPSRWVQPSNLSVRDVSHVLDGLLRPRPCGFISPHSHVQGSLFRVFPSRAAESPHRRSVPSRRLAKVRCRVASAPRPIAPPTGLSSTPESVVRRKVFSRPSNSIPS